jgi:hypothetical protein
MSIRSNTASAIACRQASEVFAHSSCSDSRYARASAAVGRRDGRTTRTGGICRALRVTPPRTIDAPFAELQERQSTAVFAMSSDAPPAASGTT